MAVSTNTRAVAGVVAAAIAVAVLTGGCGGSARHASTGGRGSGTIGGAGAAVPAPLIAAWSKAFHDRTGITVSYDPVGSGDGIAQATSAVADFGVSEVSLNDVERAAAMSKKTPLLEVPVARAALAVVYNVPGVGSGLRLDGPTLTGLFTGSITRWDSLAIRRLNPRVRLPPTAVTVVHRADSSGATATFTAFLSRGSRRWARTVGAGKVVRWPTGIAVTAHAELPRAVAGHQGAPDSGPAQAVAARPGAVSYVGVAAARRAGLSSASLPAGSRFEAPAATGAYPLAGPVYFLAFQDPCRAHEGTDVAQRLRRWLTFVTGSGQSLATAPASAPLSPSSAAAARARIRSMRCDGKPIAAS